MYKRPITFYFGKQKLKELIQESPNHGKISESLRRKFRAAEINLVRIIAFLPLCLSQWHDFITDNQTIDIYGTGGSALFGCTMVHFCAVPGCSNRSNREVNRSYFGLPLHNKVLLKTWIHKIGRENLPINANSIQLQVLNR